MVRSVLICDTAEEISALRQAALAHPDLAVEVSSDALQAIEAAARTKPDVVVCRMPMDGVPGVELLRRLLSSSPSSRVVVRLRAGDPAAASQCLAAGAGGLVTTEDRAHEVLDVARSATPGAVALSPNVATALNGSLEASLRAADQLGRELEDVRHSVSQGTSAKADFLSNVSHELRTPVTVAKGIAYVLRNPSVGEEERAEFLEQLQASLDKLMGIVDEIITVSELERGTFELALADVDLATIVRRAVEAAGARHSSIAIESSITGSLPAVADERRIEGVVTELLENACRYSPAGASVEVSARSMTEGIVVSITDRGEGLDRTVAKRSFDEPFSTGEGVLRKEKAGAGVGLHLARQLVVEHGGTLWTDPLPGGGTRAAFCIPAHDARIVAPSAGAA